MKIEENMLLFAVHLDEDEDITELIAQIPDHEKTFIHKERTWYIRNNNLSYVKRLLKNNKQISLF
jgi:hypothetical protein